MNPHTEHPDEGTDASGGNTGRPAVHPADTSATLPLDTSATLPLDFSAGGGVGP